ncbi:hypothetical protein [Streptomyces sp. NPDC016845]
MGVAVARYVVEAEPLVSMTRQDLVASVAPAIQRYLTEPPATG